MSNQQLKYFKVENFKKFDSLEVEDIGRVNLIVGDNNVGKTCLLEALLIDYRFKNTLNYYHNLLVKRNLISDSPVEVNELEVEHNFKNNVIAFYQRNKQKQITYTVNKDIYSIENIKGKIRDIKDNKVQEFIEKVKLFDYSGINKNSANWLVFKINEDVNFIADITSEYYESFLIRPSENRIPTLAALMLSDSIEAYVNSNYELIFKELDLERKISDLILQLFPNIKITNFQKFDKVSPFMGSELNIKTVQKDTYHNVREYGEGFIRCLYMIVLILSRGISKLIIDEIDTGIHYKKLKEVWEVILTLSTELNVQVFATTHSQECIEAFVEASKELGKEEEIRLIELEESDNKEKVYASTFTYEQIQSGLQSNVNMRG